MDAHTASRHMPKLVQAPSKGPPSAFQSATASGGARRAARHQVPSFPPRCGHFAQIRSSFRESGTTALEGRSTSMYHVSRPHSVIFPWRHTIVGDDGCICVDNGNTNLQCHHAGGCVECGCGRYHLVTDSCGQVCMLYVLETYHAEPCEFGSCPSVPKPSKDCPKSTNVGPNLRQPRPKSVKSGQRWQTIGQPWPRFNQHTANLGHFRPTCVNVWPALTNLWPALSLANLLPILS